ncbi:stress response protein NST1 [Cryptococcus deuterogattii R265]|uniref:stress response protein NST1 n=1 Tax=Cryptococcus deuterogattii (strain R265) TaxID=294750 RepID=UPI0019358A26|nr:stress response protein NST1 [Cryptococcus deuterogattii R265]
MSSKSQQPPTGLSKSAAKKRSKKAAKQSQNPQPQSAPQTSSQTPASVPPLPPASVPDPLDPAFFNFPGPGSYPIDVQYDDTAYYGQVDVPLSQGNFPGSYSIDYNLSLQNGSQIAGLSAPFNITHDDLISAANELYKRMADPEFGSDDAYWSSLPPHIRQFIRDAVPFTGSISQSTPGTTSSQRTMYQMAQQIVQAASQGMGLGHGMSANLMPGINANARPFPSPQQTIGEEFGFHRHPDTREEEYDDEEEIEEDNGHPAANGDAPKKKNKKKKKKGANAAAALPTSVEPPAPLPPLPPPSTLSKIPRAPAPVPQPQPPGHQPQLLSQQPPSLNPPPPPTPAPAPIPTPPSSRAAGKQPMGTNPPVNPPARSARAAGKAPASSAPPHNAHAGHSHNHPPTAKPPPKGKSPATAPPAKIWTQSSAEDRENIRVFWLGLSEAERRDLLRIEKDAVLKKMKEQHRHSCGCAVCGRKKVNIEMELDQLYEQYYDELRSYAAEQRVAANGLRPPPNGAGPFPGSVEVDANGTVTQYDHRAPELHDHDPDDLDGEESEEYDDDDDYADDDELDDDDIGTDEADVGDEIDEPPPPPPVTHRQQPRRPPVKASSRSEGGDDFLSFGSNLATIKGGILTIADDMLKNDGTKFLEMMEQLAIRRSVREEQNLRDMQEETDEEEEEEDDDESRDEPMTEKERAEEGKRMFQIFAARMFEQRVLQAYRERVAKQREEQLLRELEEEEDSKRAKEEKKAKEAQKKKDKKKAQKQKAEEERLAREAALEEEKRQAKLRKEEAERERIRRQEEERVRREAVKRAAQEEAQRQALERKRRQQEEKEREEEAARKKREREEKAKKEREAREKELKEKEKEKERKERETKAAKEKAEKEKIARETFEKAERDRMAKEAKEKAEKNRQEKLEAARMEKLRKEEATRKEREAVEQAKIIAAQQAQRERAAKAEKNTVDKAAAERVSAARVAPVAVAPVAVTVPALATLGLKSPSKGSTPQSVPPVPQLSPAKGAARPIASATPVRPMQKTPTAYYPQPVPPAGVTSFPRMPLAQNFGPPGLRPTYSTGSPAFSPPHANGSSISPNPPSRGFTDPSPPGFDHNLRTAPIGVGFPPVKPSCRIPSVVDDTFSPTAPVSRSLSSAGEIGSLISGSATPDDYRPTPPAPIAPPNLGPIGRPSFSDGQTSGLNALRSSSPPSDRVLGSAALGADDEIVQPQQRRPTTSWDMPTAAPGSGRWSASPSIWGSGDPTPASGWGAPGGMPTVGERPGPPPGLSLSPGAGASVLGQRQPSFGGIGSPFAGVGAVGSVIGGGMGVTVGGGLVQGHVGGGGYSQGLFSPQQQQQQQLQLQLQLQQQQQQQQ